MKMKTINLIKHPFFFNIRNEKKINSITPILIIIEKEKRIQTKKIFFKKTKIKGYRILFKLNNAMVEILF
jgi:hypothetical protein